MTPARFRWGMLLIQIGILLIMQNNDIIDEVAWEGLLVLFPIVLIAVGIEKIFTKSKLQFIAYLTTFALFFGGFAIALTTNELSAPGNNYFSDSVYKKSANPDVRLVKATLNLDYNDLKIRDSGSDLILAEFDQFTRKPEIEYKVVDDVALIDFLASQQSSFFGGHVIIHEDDESEWTVRFTEELPLELKCTGFDNNLHLNFLTTKLQKLKLETKNASIYLKIGFNEPYVQVFIEGEDSKMRLRVPEKCGVKVICNDTEYFLKLGLTETDDGDFINENYLEAEKKIDIEVDDRLLSFSLDYY